MNYPSKWHPLNIDTLTLLIFNTLIGYQFFYRKWKGFHWTVLSLMKTFEWVWKKGIAFGFGLFSKNLLLPISWVFSYLLLVKILLVFLMFNWFPFLGFPWSFEIWVLCIAFKKNPCEVFKIGQNNNLSYNGEVLKIKIGCSHAITITFLTMVIILGNGYCVSATPT